MEVIFTHARLAKGSIRTRKPEQRSIMVSSFQVNKNSVMKAKDKKQ